MRVPHYEISYRNLSVERSIRFSPTGFNYSVIGFEIDLRRRLQPFSMNVFLPTGILMFMSTIGFLIPADQVQPSLQAPVVLLKTFNIQVPGRMALIVTIFLMLVNFSATERSRGPQSDAMTALDIWMLICILFVAATLVEYAYILSVRFSFMSGLRGRISALSKGQIAIHCVESARPKPGFLMENVADKKLRERCQTIDRYAAAAFFVVGLFAVLVYSCTFM